MRMLTGQNIEAHEETIMRKPDRSSLHVRVSEISVQFRPSFSVEVVLSTASTLVVSLTFAAYSPSLRSRLQALEDTPLRCFRCGQKMMNMTKLKEHNLSCVAPSPRRAAAPR